MHGLGFDRDFKRWMGEAWKRELAMWFLGPSGRVLEQFFFSNREDRNGGLDHPCDERMRRLGRKGILDHNLDLGAQKGMRLCR